MNDSLSVVGYLHYRMAVSCRKRFEVSEVVANFLYWIEGNLLVPQISLKDGSTLIVDFGDEDANSVLKRKTLSAVVLSSCCN